jgi:hypothetical protein
MIFNGIHQTLTVIAIVIANIVMVFLFLLGCCCVQLSLSPRPPFDFPVMVDYLIEYIKLEERLEDQR